MKDARVSPTKLILAVIICASIVPLWYLYFHDRFQSNPLTVKYFSQNIDESNRLFMTPPNERHNSSDSFNDRGVIVLFGQNPWLKVSSFGKFEVLEPQIPALESTLGGADQKINHELNEIFLSSDIPSTACVIKKYDVDFIYVTAHSLPGRFYTDEQRIYYRQLDAFQSFAHSPFFELENEFIGENKEHIRIFSIDKSSVNAACES